nr:hypothetical protein [Chlorobium phaeovibrioides]
MPQIENDKQEAGEKKHGRGFWRGCQRLDRNGEQQIVEITVTSTKKVFESDQKVWAVSWSP